MCAVSVLHGAAVCGGFASVYVRLTSSGRSRCSHSVNQSQVHPNRWARKFLCNSEQTDAIFSRDFALAKLVKYFSYFSLMPVQHHLEKIKRFIFLQFFGFLWTIVYLLSMWYCVCIVCFTRSFHFLMTLMFCVKILFLLYCECSFFVKQSG